jgi:hypothetical protein
VSQGLAGVRKAARESKKMKFTALLHHLTVDLLRESFYSLKRKAAPGVDGVTWQEYEAGREDRLVDLHSRVHRGAYRAMPSRRVYIEKEDGRKRLLGVAALEDKIVQQAVVTILNQIYEEDFLGFSYGFRPGRSQHQALDALSYALLRKKVNYVLDADIRGFFDNLDKSWLIKLEPAHRRLQWPARIISQSAFLPQHRLHTGFVPRTDRYAEDRRGEVSNRGSWEMDMGTGALSGLEATHQNAGPQRR